jgi:uncharacterized protein (TIGR02646 family)
VIRADTSSVAETNSLRAAQERIDAATDEEAIRQVSVRRGAWLTVRETLAQAQFGKCAYCEEILRERATEVDHVRPKSRLRYWWLAFQVRNLLATCKSCNNAKGERWEVAPGARRLVARELPWDVNERAMMVVPTTDDPSEHLTYDWRQDQWHVASLTRRGFWTIGNLELDRDSYRRTINALYRDQIEPEVQRLKAAAAAGDRSAFEHARDNLTAWSRSDQPYAAFTRVAIRWALQQ